MRIASFLLFLLAFACNTPSEPVPEAPTDEQRAKIEARLINELSPESNRSGRQRNAIINYAIDELWDVKAAPEGYFYEILKAGNGEPAMMWDAVELHYQGRFLQDGAVFDDSRKRGEKLAFKVGQMIPAWNAALQQLAAGGSMRLLVPSELAYGAGGLVSGKGDTIVGAHQILVFELDGLEITERALEGEW
jgi:FKBP-type peptidyl-prolyl cis-trans isomerase